MPLPVQALVLGLLALVTVSVGLPKIAERDLHGREKDEPLPIVLWHGMGDSCCNPKSIGGIQKHIADTLGVFVYSIATGKGESADIKSSYFGNVNEQVSKVCEELQGMPELKDGFNAVGFSQGGQFLRAVVERCQHTGPKMHVLVTMGAQHEGISNVPGCEKQSVWCWVAREILGHGAYTSWACDSIIQAQYVKDPHNLDDYLKYNPFLPDINNEHDDKNPQYAANLASLDKLVLFRFSDDTVVIPRDSGWFSFFNGSDLIPMRDLEIYKQDWIGLKPLDERDAIVFDDCPGNHMNISLEWFQQNVVTKYLAPTPAEQLISAV